MTNPIETLTKYLIALSQSDQTLT